jgi:hypothetical protein
MRGRNERRDWDYYNFKLRCNKAWEKHPLGLAFDGLKETRSATCPKDSAVAGLRVHRGFQDWGDVDTYEFQLFCSAAGPGGKGSSSAATEDGNSGRRTSRAAVSGDDKQVQPSRRRNGPNSGKVGVTPSHLGSQAQGKGTFGARAAEFDAIAEDVRRELQQAEKARKQKDEL